MIAAAAPASAIEIRPAWPEDQAFVAATFADQLARGNHRDGNALADRVLDASSTKVLVAVDPNQGGKIVGWLAYAAIPRVRAVLFAYVRAPRRLSGVAKQLADAAWPARKGAWVHAGLRGSATRSLLARFPATEVKLEELL